MYIIIFITSSFRLFAQDNSECLMCHEDKDLRGNRNGRNISLFIDEKKLLSSVHKDALCIDCHIDLKDAELPHADDLKKATCIKCHSEAQKLYEEGLHGKAFAKGDPLAPYCNDCHGSHDMLKISDPKSMVAPLRIPQLCGKCHKEGSPVQLQRNIPQTHILENYSESIHGEGLLKKGLVVSATCASCHSPHRILPHTDSRSTIARKNIAKTCSKCHAEIESVHRKIIKGELWEKEANILPACVDCHQPHKVRKVFYEQGMADSDCLKCHKEQNIKAAADGRSLTVNIDHLLNSKHSKIACSQCHSGVNPSKVRPCETLTQKVDCASCHAAVGEEYKESTHGMLFSRNDHNAPKCSDCHGTHQILGKTDPVSPTFATNVPNLCGNCHREGEQAAVRYKGTEKNIVNSYTESIHGKGLMKSGLTVTATCTDCHTAHHELPHSNPKSSINKANVPGTCGNCHYGIKEMFNKSIHSPLVSNTTKELPSCNDCHTAHTIRRTDQEGFKLTIMTQCGRCHEEIAKTYFDTYHGKVSQLGYTKTAKCYDCHGAHDILPMENPASHLNRKNVVATCKKCHEGANRQFAGYFTHATHHDPEKYPFLFWTFWGMTGLLVGTFFIAGLHTLLWFPRSLKWRRELSRLHNDGEENDSGNGKDPGN